MILLSYISCLAFYLFFYFYSFKVRQIIDCYGQNMNKANPSDPVTLMGWRSMPNPGEVAIEVSSEVCFLNIKNT